MSEHAPESLAWQPIETAPKDRAILGRESGAAVRMVWHKHFRAFVRCWPGHLSLAEAARDYPRVRSDLLADTVTPDAWREIEEGEGNE